MRVPVRNFPRQPMANELIATVTYPVPQTQKMVAPVKDWLLVEVNIL